jgi:CHASE2 domain-containing sensor protein
VLVVDTAGTGHVLPLMVALSPGSGQVEALQDIARSAAVAAQVAVAVALGEDAARWDVQWSTRASSVTLEGTSLALGLALAVHAARRGRTLPVDTAYTGGLDLDGSVAEVAGIAAKVHAAAKAGIRTVVLPAGSPADPGPDLTLLPVSHWRECPDTPRTGHRWPVPVALMLPALVALLGLQAAVDPWLQGPLVAAARGRVAIDDVVVLAVDPAQDLLALRGEHAEHLIRLSALGAKAVVLDLALTRPSTVDAELARAIDQAEATGTRVVVPVRFHHEEPRGPGTPALAESPHLGVVAFHPDRLTRIVRRAPVRLRDTTGRVWWHAAVHAAGALVGSDAPELDGDTLVVGGLRSPTWAELVTLPPLGEVPILPYADPGTWTPVAGKAVVIGVHGGVDDLHRTADGPRYGAELHAGLIQTLVRQAGLRQVAPGIDVLAALGVSLLTWALGRRVPRGRWWLAGLVPLGALGLAAALALSGTLVALAPLALAAPLSLWAVRR